MFYNLRICSYFLNTWRVVFVKKIHDFLIIIFFCLEKNIFMVSCWRRYLRPYFITISCHTCHRYWSLFHHYLYLIKLVFYFIFCHACLLFTFFHACPLFFLLIYRRIAQHLIFIGSPLHFLFYLFYSGHPMFIGSFYFLSCMSLFIGCL